MEEIVLKEGSALRITRRKLLTDFAYVGGGLAIASETSAALIGSARAQTVSIEELKNPGPLPDMILGWSGSPVTIIEYASMTCGHCGQFAVTTFPELKVRYIDTGKVRYTFREYPLDYLAAAASMLARSVAEDRYFDVIEALFRQQRQWVANRIEPLMTLATKELGFTEQQLQRLSRESGAVRPPQKGARASFDGLQSKFDADLFH